MTLIRNVTGAAFVVAEYRAEENFKENPLYRDPIVHVFLDEETKRAADKIFASFPPVKIYVWLRTRFLDERLDAQLRGGFRQVAILGAGLDTRPQRKASPGAFYFEIDDGATLAFKQARLEASGIAPNVAYIAGDYVAHDLAANIGARLADRVTVADLRRLYWPGKTPQRRLFDYYSICTLEAG